MEQQKFSFEGLEAHKKGRILVKHVYALQRQFPADERFALCEQVRRASVSITSNLAEGSGRTSLKDKLHFIVIAYGSLMELFSQLLTAHDLGYLDENQIDTIRPEFIELARIMSGMRQSLQLRIKKADLTPAPPQ